jgi:hypothetical protein
MGNRWQADLQKLPAQGKAEDEVTWMACQGKTAKKPKSKKS